jgi:tRNA pseudouridine55 synthase
MDGVLLIDKPAGPTSHDVVARLRRTSGERRAGHTGTLDPRATGLLCLVLGRATRLASVLTGADKTYEAVVHLGVTTTTDDADGAVLETWDGPLPDDTALAAALEDFRGTYDQRPPAHSAKKVGGRKAYELARRDEPVELAPVPVTVRALALTGRNDVRVALTVTATAGFYVRALARDLGARLRCGAHLEELRRTRVGRFAVSSALSLDVAERLGPEVEGRLVSPSDALAQFPAVTVTEAGLRRVVHGNSLMPEHLEGRAVPSGDPDPSGRVRVLGTDGHLVALAHLRGGVLHPAVVLG